MYTILWMKYSLLVNKAPSLWTLAVDFSSPIWWRDPYALFPKSRHYSLDEFIPPQDAEMLVDDIGVDSGSLVFLPSTETMPTELGSTLTKLIGERNAVLMPAPKGIWSLFYEQFDPPQDNMTGLYRNIVLKIERWFLTPAQPDSRLRWVAWEKDWITKARLGLVIVRRQ